MNVTWYVPSASRLQYLFKQKSCRWHCTKNQETTARMNQVEKNANEDFSDLSSKCNMNDICVLIHSLENVTKVIGQIPLGA